MDDLQSELKELKQFIADLKADRVAAKEKEQRESWTKYVSLTVVVIAVFAGIDAQWAGKYGSMSQMSQAQASDQWSFYQAQSVKQHLFEVTRRQLPKNATDPEALQQQKEYEAKIADYDARKTKIKEDAEKLEKKRDYAGRVGAKLGLALSCFSISIAMASICMMSKKKPLWFLAMALAAFGVVQMIVGKSIPMP
ncbi:MAG: DUF4337 domain-containing protein [Limisphaerales bacterium]